MRLVDSQRREKVRRIGGHVVEGIGRCDRLTRQELRHHGAEMGRAELGQMRRPADVAVVEPDDAESFRRQPVAERVRPACELARKAHAEKNDRCAFAPDAFEFKIDAVGADARYERGPNAVSGRP